METNRSACSWLAIDVRVSSGMKVSSLRVYTTSAPSRACNSLPSRRPTSSTRSFSSRPLGPMVPVSCPPWPGSITILPIFKPRARISDRSPLAVGEASRTSGKASAILLLPFAGVLTTLAADFAGTETTSGGSSLATVAGVSLSESSASTTVFFGPLTLAGAAVDAVINGTGCFSDAVCTP